MIRFFNHIEILHLFSALGSYQGVLYKNNALTFGAPIIIMLQFVVDDSNV